MYSVCLKFLIESNKTNAKKSERKQKTTETKPTESFDGINILNKVFKRKQPND